MVNASILSALASEMNFDFGVEGFLDILAEGAEGGIFGGRDAELAELY